MISGSDDETLRLWDLEEGQNYGVLEGHTGPVLSCMFSKSEGGKRWAVSGSWDKSLKIWDADSGLCTQTLSSHSAPVYGCGWSDADGGEHIYM